MQERLKPDILQSRFARGEFALKIFLGYPSEHRETAREVFGFLKEKGDEVWFDVVSLIAGDDWDNERYRAQKEAELVIHLCSDAILRRVGVVNREIKQTLRFVDDQPLGALYVIPIRLEPIKLPVELLRFQYIDKFDPSWKERLSAAVEKRRVQLSRDTSPTPSQNVTEERPAKGSQTIEFEDAAEAYECRGEYFCYNDEGLYWEYVNGAIASHALEGFYPIRSEFRRLAEDDCEPDENKEWTSAWSISTQEFFRYGDMVSIRFYTYIGYARSAHPNHHITSLNFFGENSGTIDIQQLLSHSFENAQKIIAYCEKLIAALFEEGELGERTFFENYKENEENTWKLLSHFNFDRQGLTFNFSPYDVLPYVFGSHEIQVPWKFLNEMVSEEYKVVVDKLFTSLD